MDGDEGLEQVGETGQGVSTAAPQHVALGILSLGGDTLGQLTGTGDDDLNVDVGVSLTEHLHTGLQGAGVVGGVDDQVAGVVFGLLLSGSLGLTGGFVAGGGGLGLNGLLGAAGDQRQNHNQSQNQSKDLLHVCFLLIVFLLTAKCHKAKTGEEMGTSSTLL